MTPVYKLTVLFVGLWLLFNCNKGDFSERDFPRIRTLPVTDISDQGARFTAEILYRGNQEVLHYGFIWSKKSAPEFDNSDKIQLGQDLKTNSFSEIITRGLKTGDQYYMRAYLFTKDYTVYGNIVSFKSLGGFGPTILSYFPVVGSCMDSIKILGSNFSYNKEDIQVKIGEINCPVIQSTDSMIVCKVPLLTGNELELILSVSGNMAVASTKFTYLNSEILNITPMHGTYNDTIFIYGRGLLSSGVSNVVKFGNQIAQIVIRDSNLIKVLVPVDLTVINSPIVVNGDCIHYTHDHPFELDLPIIISFEPDTVFKPNTIITLHGKNFSPITHNNYVYIDGFPCTVLESSKEIIKVHFNEDLIPIPSVSVLKDVAVYLRLDYKHSIADRSLSIRWESTWTLKNYFGGVARHNAVSFSLKNKGYLGLGANVGNDFYEYDPTIDSWRLIGYLGDQVRVGAVAFTIGNNAYVGLGTRSLELNQADDIAEAFKEFYKFDPQVNSWSRIADFPGLERHSAAGFVIHNEAYVGSGVITQNGVSTILDDYWKYNPVKDEWIETSPFPRRTFAAAGINIGNDGYVYDYNTLYKYNGIWSKLESKVLNLKYSIIFSIKNNIYFGMGMTDDLQGSSTLCEYNVSNGQSRIFSLDPALRRWGASVFVINNKAYIMGGAHARGFGNFEDVWEFDPSKPE